jgi:hypothetical protein
MEFCFVNIKPHGDVNRSRTKRLREREKWRGIAEKEWDGNYGQRERVRER